MRRRAALAVLLLGSLLAGTVVLPPAAIAAGSDPGTRVLTKELTRAHTNADGTTTVVDSKSVTLRVSQTRDLHSRQPIEVSWTGAHPTGGVVADPSSSVARLQEYPFVLMECRGVDSAAVEPARRLSPRTCWTQSVQERFQSDNHTAFPPWRVDAVAAPADRQAVVGAPAPRPATCGSPAPAEHWLPFVSVSGRSYSSNLSLCGSQAPEVSNVGGSGQPSNTTYAITEASGSGSTRFTTWTEEDNASLGCSDTVPCALVAIPVMGISCDESAKALPAPDRPTGDALEQAKTGCRAAGHYAPGAPNQNSAGNDAAVSGALWWSASNWAGRIVVPLDFAPPANVCDIAAARKGGVDIYGSELLVQATSQWRPRFCLGRSGSPFKHVQVGEPQAKSLLTNGTIGAAFVSDPPAGGWSRPVVDAPTAISGFSISYVIDGAHGQEYAQLRLTPRLLAKLLTQSYPALTPIRDEYKALSKNPLNITVDPEFRALNPGVPAGVGATAAASELFSLSSDSDVLTALTSYIQADPDARSFLDGDADPSGMVVNPSYKGIVLPVDSWPQRDTFQPKAYYASGQNECLQAAPVPFLPLVSAPTARMASISLALQFGLANSQIDCVAVPGLADGVGSKLVAQGRQQPGFRFLIGITSVGDAQRYALDAAQLQTVKGSFVGPSDEGLLAAARLMAVDVRTKTWRLPYARVLASTTAYPGTMPIYTAVATSNLSAADAKGYGAFLRFVAATGQVRGLANGQLPPGFVPLNSVPAMATYTIRSAEAVELQTGAVPAIGARPLAPAPAVAPQVVGPVSRPGTSVTPPLKPFLPVTPPAAPFGPIPPPVLGPVERVTAIATTTPVLRSPLAASLLPALIGFALLASLFSRLTSRGSR